MAGEDGSLCYRAGDFVVDGALRDVCVLDAVLADWEAVLSALRDSGWPTGFCWTIAETEATEVLPTADEIFRRLTADADESATLTVDLDGIVFRSYFFDVDEIEFTFDPGDVTDAARFPGVASFVRLLGNATGKRVVVLMESTDHAGLPALLSYQP